MITTNYVIMITKGCLHYIAMTLRSTKVCMGFTLSTSEINFLDFRLTEEMGGLKWKRPLIAL